MKPSFKQDQRRTETGKVLSYSEGEEEKRLLKREGTKVRDCGNNSREREQEAPGPTTLCWLYRECEDGHLVKRRSSSSFLRDMEIKMGKGQLENVPLTRYPGMDRESKNGS